tara:strand:- start:2564 stop:3022 length:459 start_codon:yes stop_codon:yes gene_type:complete
MNTWIRNITQIEDGIYRTIEGNADEIIAIGRIIKAGFSCSRVDLSNSRYDAIVQGNSNKLFRIQIKGIGNNSFSFMGGGRSGRQINRNVQQKTRKYTKDDCDFMVGITKSDGVIYIIPIEDVEKMGNSRTLTKLGKFKENWQLLYDLTNMKK